MEFFSDTCCLSSQKIGRGGGEGQFDLLSPYNFRNIVFFGVQQWVFF